MGSLDDLSLTKLNPLDHNSLKSQLQQATDLILSYYRSIESLPILPDVEPGYLRSLLPATPPADPLPFDATLLTLNQAVLPGLTNWVSPNFFAYFPATLSSASIAGELIASAVNNVGFTWVSSPAASELEGLVVDWLAQLLELPREFRFGGGGRGGGILHGTASESILCTIVAARDAALRRSRGSGGGAGGAGGGGVGGLVAYVSDQTHSTVYKACKVAGFSPGNVRFIETHADSHFSLTPELLREAMEADVEAGLVPAYVCATVGTTSSNAVDPVGPIADVAREFGAWVHVDAAYAGSACVCPEFRCYLSGLERVDSVSTSLHKWLLTCVDCTCLWVRDRTMLTESLGTNPEYLKNGPSESGLVVDLKDMQLGTSRPFRALKLYVVIQTYGSTNLKAHIRSDVHMAHQFEKRLRSDSRFELVAPRRFALVCFRLAPRGADPDAADAENRRLLQLVNASGRAYMTHTVLGGKYVIRFAVGSTLTEERHVDAAWELISEKADEVLRDAEEPKKTTINNNIKFIYN